MNQSIRLWILKLISFLLVLSGCFHSNQHQVNSIQARLMLNLLKDASGGKKDMLQVDQILETRGMHLIIKQQNVRGKINVSQYKTLLLGLTDEHVPDIQPVDSSERASLGTQRLKEQVWQVLKWGTGHVDSLEIRLQHIKDLDVGQQAKALADSFLPEPLSSIPEIYIVMGGRAGFFAGEEQIYIDLLLMSFSSARRGELFISDEEIVRYFAHEMHHIGLNSHRNKQLKRMTLDERESRAMGFISSLVSEGSASYLISWNRDNQAMRSRYGRLFEMGDELFEICANVLQSILAGDIKNDDMYSRITEPLLGMGYHVTGSKMMDIIYQSGGLDSVMRVLNDPRLLLSEYNKSSRQLMAAGDSTGIYLFDKNLAQMTMTLGQ